jgi:hypothetical protein
MTGSPSTLRSLLVIGIAAAAWPGMPAAAQQIETFGAHWFAVCDNARNCSAFGVHAGPAPGYMRIDRAGTADAEIKITLTLRYPDRPFRLTLEPPSPGLLPEDRIMPELDSDEHMRIPITAPAPVVVKALREAKTLAFTPIDATPYHQSKPGKIALTGALDALAWIDAQQMRAGTVTALVEPGTQPAVAMPPVPQIVAVATTRTKRETPPPDYPPALRARADTICGPQVGKGGMRSPMWLGDTHVMYGFVCDARGSNLNPPNVLLAAAADNPAAAAEIAFDYPPAVAALQKMRTMTATNPDFDRRNGVLESFHFDSPAEVCGTAARWHWTGHRFELALLRVMPVCGGIRSKEWPVVYRAMSAEAPPHR